MKKEVVVITGANGLVAKKLISIVSEIRNSVADKNSQI